MGEMPKIGNRTKRHFKLANGAQNDPKERWTSPIELDPLDREILEGPLMLRGQGSKAMIHRSILTATKP